MTAPRYKLNVEDGRIVRVNPHNFPKQGWIECTVYGQPLDVLDEEIHPDVAMAAELQKVQIAFRDACSDRDTALARVKELEKEIYDALPPIPEVVEEEEVFSVNRLLDQLPGDAAAAKDFLEDLAKTRYNHTIDRRYSLERLTEQLRDLEAQELEALDISYGKEPEAA